MRLACLALALSLAACTEDPVDPPAGAVGLNDVSVLFPLPPTIDEPAQLSLASAGKGGPLLTEARFAAIPVFADNPLPERAYDRWRIVAARIDPCFPDLAVLVSNPAACRRQLRLVAQPLGADVSGVTVEDASIHLLYDLAPADFDALATAWLAVGNDQTHDPRTTLGIHPVIANEGLAGPTATTLRGLVTTYAGEGTLSQFTFVEGRGVAWEFGGMRVDGAGQNALPIHGIEDASGQVTASDTNGVFSVSPASAEARAMDPLAGEVSGGGIGGGTVTLTASADAITAALRTTLTIDDPTTLNADTVDCAACHLATRARERARTLGASSDGLPRFAIDGFDLSLGDLGSAAASPQQQRAFGYNGRVAMWNQRVINESAAVADVLANR
ncbi:MAG: hypothetical protein K8W52_09575 [Deltaproteobacteria bacterium]|nr:hypothetical protein [Deltaproteobacteria bacterium]